MRRSRLRCPDRVAVLIPPMKAQRKRMLKMLQRVIAKWRNRVETSFGEITDRMELARHGAHTFWGLLTRTAATIAAHTLLLTGLTEAAYPATLTINHITRLRGCARRPGRSARPAAARSVRVRGRCWRLRPCGCQ